MRVAAALVGAEHDVVRRRVAKGRQVLKCWPNFEVTTTALDILLIFCLVLNNELFALIAERVKGCRHTKELRIFCRLQAPVLFIVLADAEGARGRSGGIGQLCRPPLLIEGRVRPIRRSRPRGRR